MNAPSDSPAEISLAYLSDRTLHDGLFGAECWLFGVNSRRNHEIQEVYENGEESGRKEAQKTQK